MSAAERPTGSEDKVSGEMSDGSQAGEPHSTPTPPLGGPPDPSPDTQGQDEGEAREALTFGAKCNGCHKT